MIFVMTYGCLSLALAFFLALRIRRAPERLYTFIVDPPTMFLVALLSAIIGLRSKKGTTRTQEQFRKRRRIIDGALAIFTVAFWTSEALSYFNVLGHPFNHAKSGNDFMWNGYLPWHLVDTSTPTYHSVWMNLLALALLALQLGALVVGRHMGYQAAYYNNLDHWSRPKR